MLAPLSPAALGLLALLAFVLAAESSDAAGVTMNASELHAAALNFGGRIGRAADAPHAVTPGIFRFQSARECESAGHCLGGSKTLPVGTVFAPFSFTEENKRDAANREASCRASFMCGGGAAGPLSAAFKLAPSEAIVMIGFTPPSMFEWSFNSLVYSRRFEPPASADPTTLPGTGPFVTRPCDPHAERCVTLAPLSAIASSGTRQRVKVGRSTWRGVNAQPVAIIVTASRNTTATVRAHLLDAGISDSTINVLPIPPVRLGLNEDADLLSVALRMRGSFDSSSRARYVNNPPFTVFRITPLPKISEAGEGGEDQGDDGVGRPLLLGEAYTWEDAEGLQTEDAPLLVDASDKSDGADDDSAETAPAAAAAPSSTSSSSPSSQQTKETLLDNTHHHKPIALEKMMDVLQNELVRVHRKDRGWGTAGGGGGGGLGYTVMEDLVVPHTPRDLVNPVGVEGRTCLAFRMQCNGPSSNSDITAVARTEAAFVLGAAAAGEKSDAAAAPITVGAVMFGVVHTKTNMTNRMIVAVLDAETDEEVLTLDDRAFGRSARRLLMGTVASNLPLYAIKIVLRRGDDIACPRNDAGCYTIGERMRGRPLVIEERTYVPSLSGEDFPQAEQTGEGEAVLLARRLVKPRLLMLENEVGQKERVNALPDSEVVGSLGARGSALSEAEFGGPGPEGLAEL